MRLSFPHPTIGMKWVHWKYRRYTTLIAARSACMPAAKMLSTDRWDVAGRVFHQDPAAKMLSTDRWDVAGRVFHQDPNLSFPHPTIGMKWVHWKYRRYTTLIAARSACMPAAKMLSTDRWDVAGRVFHQDPKLRKCKGRFSWAGTGTTSNPSGSCYESWRKLNSVDRGGRTRIGRTAACQRLFERFRMVHDWSTAALDLLSRGTGSAVPRQPAHSHPG